MLMRMQSARHGGTHPYSKHWEAQEDCSGASLGYRDFEANLGLGLVVKSQINKLRAGELAQWFRAFAPPTEHLSAVPST